MGELPESVAGQDIWLVKPIQEVGSVNNSPISKIGLGREGGISITTKGQRATLSVAGVTISLGKIEGVPGMARPFTKHVGIRSLSILENGDFVAKLSAPLLSLPFRVNGNAESETVDRLNLFGIKFRL
jgi:hypothetical protein